jgi:CubicO group peptidase (beta-lactamase class C family)
MELARTPRAAADANNGVGLGWHVGRRLGGVWHNGQTGGYHAWVGFVPGRKVGVVVLANTAGGLPDAVGVALLRRLCGEPAEPPKPRMTVALDPETLDAYPGQYRLTPTFSITITRDRDRLYAQATGQPRLRIYPESAAKFFYKAVDAQLTFERDPAGKVASLVLHQNGMNLPAPRM